MKQPQPDTTLHGRASKSLTAIGTQNGTNAPSLSFILNTLGDIKTTYYSMGEWILNSNHLFTIDKTIATITNDIQISIALNLYLAIVDDTEIDINARAFDNTPIDGARFFITITVFQ